MGPAALLFRTPRGRWPHESELRLVKPTIYWQTVVIVYSLAYGMGSWLDPSPFLWLLSTVVYGLIIWAVLGREDA
jgi:hypothetical protein